MESSAIRCARYFERLREEFGGKCQGMPDARHSCGSRDCLEFAHVGETPVRGRGRGQWARYYDIKRNRHAYRLLCKKCHMLMDGPAYFSHGWVPQREEIPF